MARLKQGLLTAAGLLAVTAVIVLLSPDGELATAPTTAPARTDRVEVAPSPQTARPATTTGPEVSEADRNVTGQGLTRSFEIDDSKLIRLPDRLAKLQEDAEKQKQPEKKVILLQRPIVLDTGHIQVGESTIALSGVEAVPVARQCGSGGAAWPCGMRSRTELRNLLRARSIRCQAPEDFGRSKQTIDTQCTLQGADIGEWIVRNGWATAPSGSSYAEAEAEARRERRGIWREASTPSETLRPSPTPPQVPNE